MVDPHPDFVVDILRHSAPEVLREVASIVLMPLLMSEDEELRARAF